MKNIFYYISLFTIILALFLMFICIYWVVYPYKVLMFKRSILQIFNTKVKQGETLFYEANYCKYMNLPVTVSRSFVDGIIYDTPSVTNFRDTGCFEKVIQIPVPTGLPPGKYHLENTYTTQVNPLRKITVRQKSDYFYVLTK